MTRSYRNIGLTQREKAIWPPKKTYQDYDLLFTLILVIVLVSALVHFFVEPSWRTVPVMNPQTAYLSDKQQEKLYCKEALNGYPVKDATMQALQDHCARFN